MLLPKPESFICLFWLFNAKLKFWDSNKYFTGLLKSEFLAVTCRQKHKLQKWKKRQIKMTQGKRDFVWCYFQKRSWLADIFCFETFKWQNLMLVVLFIHKVDLLMCLENFIECSWILLKKSNVKLKFIIENNHFQCLKILWCPMLLTKYCLDIFWLFENVMTSEVAVHFNSNNEIKPKLLKWKKDFLWVQNLYLCLVCNMDTNIYRSTNIFIVSSVTSLNKEAQNHLSR